MIEEMNARKLCAGSVEPANCQIYNGEVTPGMSR
jgi:hypothetical protein